MLYASGRGVDLDYKKARECWEDSYSLGFPAAAYNIGILYISGKGVAESREEAAKWFSLSCRGGYHEGCDAAGKTSGRNKGGAAAAGKKSSAAAGRSTAGKKDAKAGSSKGGNKKDAKAAASRPAAKKGNGAKGNTGNRKNKKS